MHWVSIARPAFDAQYASDVRARTDPRRRRDGDDRPAPRDEVLDRRPRHEKRAGEIRPQDVVPTPARSSVRSDPSPPVPALQTSPSRPPKRATVVCHRALGVRGVARVRDDRTASDLGRDLLDRPAAAPGDGDRVAVGGESPGDGGADARPAAGDERDPGHPSSFTVSRSSTV